jgi:hypothetical protein
MPTVSNVYDDAASTNSLGVLFSVPAANTLLVGGAACRGGQNITDMTENSSGSAVSMTLIDSQLGGGADNNGRRVHARYATNPTVGGIYSLTTTFSASTQASAGALVITGADLTSPIRAVAKDGQASGGSISVSVASEPGDLIIVMVSGGILTTISFDENLTQLVQNDTTAMRHAIAWRMAAESSSSTTVTATVQSTIGSAMIAIAIKPAPTGGAFNVAWNASANSVVQPGAMAA